MAIWNFKNKYIELMADLITVLLFLIVVALLSSALFNSIFPKPQSETDLSFMLTPYLKLPFAFWLLLGFGLFFGMTLHGFTLVSSNSDSHNKTIHYAEPKKKEKEKNS